MVPYTDKTGSYRSAIRVIGANLDASYREYRYAEDKITKTATAAVTDPGEAR
jgi:hypothetical protein